MQRARKSAPKLANLNHQFAPVLSESRLLGLTWWQLHLLQTSSLTPDTSFALLVDLLNDIIKILHVNNFY
jgi:hypothetical protein